jgi:AraC-like DNA-binding protein
MCTYAAASISKVQRLFQRELGLTPSQYVTARRLAAARRELKYCTPEETHVADIALKFGFNHLGRFSGLFRTQFGELPSETLNSI